MFFYFLKFYIMSVEKNTLSSSKESTQQSNAWSLVAGFSDRVSSMHNREISSSVVGFVCESGDGIKNEDTILTNEGAWLYGVFDGVSSIGGSKIDGKTGWAIASQITADAINTTKTLQEWLKVAQQKLQEINPNAQNNLDRFGTVLGVAKVWEKDIEYVKLWDVTLLAIKSDGTFEHLWTHDNHDEETLLIKKRLIEAWEFDSKNPEFHDKLVEVRMDGNKEYGVMNGQEEYVNFVEQWTISRQWIVDILIFSDGLYSPSEDPSSEPDLDTIVSIYKQSGVQGLKEWIREIEMNDPDCQKYIRFKKHDDLSIVAIELS